MFDAVLLGVLLGVCAKALVLNPVPFPTES